MRRLREALRRHALAAWFIGLGTLAALRGYRALMDAPDAILSWTWLAGALGCIAVGIVLLVTSRRRS